MDKILIPKTMNKAKQLGTLKRGLIERKNLLQKVQHEIISMQEKSDFGWLMTLGAQELGMLTAVESSKQVRSLQKIEKQLESEISLIFSSIKYLQAL